MSQESQKKQFTAKVVSIGETFIPNSNGTKYVIATIEHPVNGKLLSGRIYENNLIRDGKVAMEPGNSYLCTAQTYTDPAGALQVDITISHLTNAPRATSNDFDTLPGEVQEVELQGTGTAKQVATT